MPPKKRSACNPRKPRLVFLESPLEGPVHDYGPTPPRAETKCASTKPLDPSASASWVSPQFDQALELHFPARRRRRHVSNNNTVQSRAAGGANRSQHRVAGRKPSVCKFPSLSFTTAEILETQSFCTTRRRPEQNWAAPAPAVPTSPPSPEGRSYGNIPSPPDIRTPEPSPKPNHLLSPSAIQTPLSRHRPGNREATDTPLANSPGLVLAEDTPEHEYGIRPTWRRRQRLMRYLKSRGKLKSNEILVKP
ncbi:LOW QUALITY PROTEIN: RAD9, HUS1, RAD1-interacting nuclear orphan protein 1 [Hyla sarda]|uniref:LOW QUALITY PROTEIN: RAD9, HUS1, RAD1-interacting nuclear orphan protein 1 n=1 Tax=Hyla sarda TaxID=327740 RepID=UPI0024C31C9A|nr:LOW QUALITY PROTEIN: RAD9, HUS1, RAD1-interacting nuclear orphan protein 1 [Hyla sarda]